MPGPIEFFSVTHFDFCYSSWIWPFSVQRRSDIDAYFERSRSEKPKLFNGRVLLGRNPVFSGDIFRASFFETDFASFLAWCDWGFPDTSVFNGFGVGALRTGDGAFVLGEMGAHTANSGKIYCPAGTPDLNDVYANTVDIQGSVSREIEEEVGLKPDDYIAAHCWDVVSAGSLIAMIRILDVPASGDALCARIEANLALQVDQELSAIHLVRSESDFSPMMPEYIRAFLTMKLKAGANGSGALR